MAGEQRRFSDLLLEALDEMSDPVALPAGEIEARAAELQRMLAETRRKIDAEDAAAEPGLTEQDVSAFVSEGRRLTHDQQRLLFADPGLRALFRDLKRRNAVVLPAAADQAAGPRFAELPALRAAATEQGAEFERPFAGGTLRINPVGIDEQVYVVFSFDDPAVATRVLFVERPRDSRIERLDLPPPDDGEIVLIKDLAVPADAELVDMLRDFTTSGDFQK
ncbi:MAG: hypothetical protein U1E60_11350 [Reyranellaceae bacterium]